MELEVVRVSFNALRALGYFSTAVKFRHFNSLFLLRHFRGICKPPLFTPLKFLKKGKFMAQFTNFQ